MNNQFMQEQYLIVVSYFLVVDECHYYEISYNLNGL